MKKTPLLQQKWESGATREFYLSDEVTDASIVTSVFGIGFWDNKLMMTKTHRGWELPGGHVELGETLQEALHREIKEEAGAIVVSEKVIGHIEIQDVKEKINKATGIPYPMLSHMILYHITATEAPGCHDGEECIDSGIFSLDSDEVKCSHHYDLISVICENIEI